MGLLLNALIGWSIILVVVSEDTSTSTLLVLELAGMAVAQQLLIAFHARTIVPWLWLPATLIGGAPIAYFPQIALLAGSLLFILAGVVAGIFLGAMQSIVMSYLFPVQAIIWIASTAIGSTLFAVGLGELVLRWPLWGISFDLGPFNLLQMYEVSWPLFIAIPQAIHLSRTLSPS